MLLTSSLAPAMLAAMNSFHSEYWMRFASFTALLLFWVLPLHACEFSASIEPDCAEELEEELEAPLKLQRSTNLLHLPTRQQALAFPVVPSRRTDEYTKPYVVAYFKEVQLAVVWVFETKGRSVYLVHLHSGEQTQVNGFPLLSPDRKRLLVYSEATTDKDNAKLLAIYRLTKQGKLTPELALSGDDNRLQPWNPVDVAWQSPTKVRFVRLYHSAGQQQQQHHVLEFSERQWRLVQ
ncbi:hypothetical protein [Rheinheimera sp.]|uniref:hypothetical protein n=1 Tax=Rheinheimera sp. TaxID=1869214 RepID=UPI00307F951F